MTILPRITITSPTDFSLELGPNRAWLHGPDSEAGAEVMRQKLAELGFGGAETVYAEPPTSCGDGLFAV